MGLHTTLTTHKHLRFFPQLKKETNNFLCLCWNQTIVSLNVQATAMLMSQKNTASVFSAKASFPNFTSNIKRIL